MNNIQIKRLLEEIIKNSCEKSYKALFVGLYDSMFSFSNNILQSKEDAEEVTSDFFINLWQKRYSFTIPEVPKLYMLIAIKNMSINKLKANSRNKIPNIDQWEVKIDSIYFNPEDLLLSTEALNRIINNINSLPPKCRMVFKLVKEEGLTYSETAALLGLSIKTIENQMAIAFKKIKSSLGISSTYIFHQ